MINLFLNDFIVTDPKRKAEFDFCLTKNEENPFIDHIYFLKSNDEIDIYNRPSYNDFFAEMRKYPNDINIISNSDIYFDETIQLTEKIKSREVYALTRWEKTERYDQRTRKMVEVIMFFNQKNPAHPPRSSQDVWIMRGGPRIENASFGLGINGCDNKIAWLLRAHGYKVRNPSYSIRCIHVHKEPTIRANYTVPRPYLFIEPTSL